MAIKEAAIAHLFNYDQVIVATYHADIGDGLPAHEHKYAHTTQCHAGKIIVRKASGTWLLDKDTKPLLLKQNEWHEIEALESNTVFVNISINEGVKKWKL